jgi:methanogenic corrinoid protein MtbC1
MRGALDWPIERAQAPDGLGQGIAADAGIRSTFSDVPALDLGTLMASLLTQAVAEEVLPRLLLTHAREKRRPADSSLRPSARHVVDLARLSVSPDGAGAMRLVQGLLARGMPTDSICLDLLAPAARRLGALWLQDRCDFALVTIGVANLSRIHDTMAAEAEIPAAMTSRRILLAVVPGEQHVFGVSMLAGFFRRAGWSVATGPFATERELVAAVRRESFDMIGLSVSAVGLLDGLGLLLRRLRRASRHRGLRIMVGGPALAARPEAASLLGADATATDAPEAVALAGSMTSLLAAAT